MPFVKGQSGNPYGRPPGPRDERTKTSLRAARVVEKEEEEVKNRERTHGDEENQVRNRGGSSVGIYILLFLLFAVLILLLVDHFVLEGKILGWFFGQSKPEDQSEVTEQKVELIGFEGRSLSDI
ncbi:hypothetical protein ES703_64323 [subsurface metagenome]